MRFVCSMDEPDAGVIRRISEENGIPVLLAKTLYFRGVTEKASIQEFLNPELSLLHNPFLLPDMEIAVERIKRAIEQNERILVYGDYDADGVCATAILLRYFKSIGANVSYHLPSRFNEGYGMRMEPLERIASNGINLIITVDNGISAIDEIAYCAKRGIDVIVTDHHQCPPDLPECIAIVDAHRQDSEYPCPHLCGAGVALKLVQALGAEIEDYLPLAALATVADVVPVTGENRIIVAQGLKRLNRNIGLEELLRVSGSGADSVASDVLAFRLAPRINAAGRMGSADHALELLMEDDDKRAHELALKLNDENAERQREEQRIFNEAVDMLSCEDVEALPAILLYSESWSSGVIGIVASKLVEKYYKPVMLFHQSDGILTGSCRSIQDIDIFACLLSCSEKLQRFGGHARAAGLSVDIAHFEEFKREVFTYLRATIPAHVYERAYPYEIDAALTDFSIHNVSALFGLAPHGEGNPKPVFRTSAVRLNDMRRMGATGAHMRAYAIKDGARLPLVAFGHGDLADRALETVDMLYTVDINNYMERKKLQLQLCAINTGEEKSAERQKVYDAFFRGFIYNVMNKKHGEMDAQIIAPLNMPREQMGLIYNHFLARLKEGPLKRTELLSGADYDKKTLALMVFIELGLMGYDEADDTVILHKNAERRELKESVLYSAANAV